MITVSHQARTRTLLALTVLTMTVTAGACGSSRPAAASGASATARQTCQQVDAVLSDGPDPGADPLGHAEAQIVPLRQIHASDPVLSQAIGTLASAYSSFYAANGTSGKAALTAAINRINSLCPGAGATT